MEVIIQWVSKLFPVIQFTKICNNLSLFVSDFCSEIYQQFLSRHTYLISCPTGKGKSHMVTRDIIPLAYARKKKVLLLVNRIRLAEQYLKDIKDTVVKGIINYNPNNHSLVNDIEGCLLILTYQQLELRLANNLEATLLELDKYDIVIADEVHYWLSDSTFNPRSRLSAEAVLMFLCPKTRYLMSATMDDIRPVLLEPGRYMTPLFSPRDRFYNPISIESASRFEYDTWAVRNYEYIMPADYSYVDVHYFNDIDTVIDYIVESEIDSQWLIFKNNIKECKRIVKDIKNRFMSAHPNYNPDNVVSYIDSDYRDIEDDMQEVVDYITEKENFKSKVLVSTSVLDCGINLKSNDLLHIVICTDNKITFRQMLGRKRLLSSSDRVNIYIPSMNLKYFTRRVQRIEEIFSDVDQVCISDFDRYMTNILYTKDDPRAASFRTIAFPFVESNNKLRQTRLVISELSRNQLRLLYENYQRIISRYDTEGVEAFIKEQLDWLGLSYDSDNWMPDTSHARMKKVVEKKLYPYINTEFSEDELKPILDIIKPEILKVVKEARSNRVFPKHAIATLDILHSDIKIIATGDNQYIVKQDNQINAGYIQEEDHV